MNDGPRKIIRKQKETGASGIENTCKRWARDRGFYVRKFASPGNRSVPDDIFAKDGTVVFVEFKAPGKTPTELQEEEHKALRDAGLDVMVFDSVESFKHYFLAIEAEWL